MSIFLFKNETVKNKIELLNETVKNKIEFFLLGPAFIINQVINHVAENRKTCDERKGRSCDESD